MAATVAQKREKAAQFLAKRCAAYSDNPAEVTQRARKAMNSLYRLAGLSERLCDIQNDERLYNRYKGRRLEEMERRESNWMDRVSGYLEEFNADVCYSGIYPSVVERKKTESGGVVDLQLMFWYD